VICIAEAYSKFDIDTVEVVPLRIELFRYRYYEDNVFALEPVNVTEAPNYVTQANPAKSTSTPTSSTGVEALLARADDNTAELFKELRERILELDDTVEEKANTLYVAYKRSNNFAEVHIGKSQLKIHLRPINYVDPEGKVDNIPDGYNWTMDRRIYLKSKGDLDYVVNIIEQSYQNVL
jgi:predicted transport protein